MTAADQNNTGLSAKIASSVLLLAVNRITSVAMIPTVLALATVSWIYISYRFDTQSAATTAAAVTASDAATKAVSVASDLVQTKQSLADDVAQQAQFRAETKADLEKHSDALTAISTTLGEVSGKLDTDIQYWHQQGRP